MSPVWAASSPRQRRLAARAEARSSRRAFPSYQPRSSHRLLAPAELDQRFDIVDNEADGRRLDDRLTAHEFERWIKTCDHPFRRRVRARRWPIADEATSLTYQLVPAVSSKARSAASFACSIRPS